MPNPAPKIFLSSTSTDLLEERKIADNAISRNYFCINMEKWSGSPYPPKYKIIEELKQASAVVLILGFKYGSLMNDEEISYTEFEFNYAKEHGIDIYAFIKTNENNKEESDEIEEERKSKFKNFKENIEDGRTVVYFRDIHELETEILNTLNKNDDKIQKNKYFTNKFFKDKLKGSIDDLGPRYNSKINIDLELDFFNVMAKNRIFKENFTKKFTSYYCELKRLKVPSKYQKTIHDTLKKLKNEYEFIFKDIDYEFSNLYDLIKDIEEFLVEISKLFNENTDKKHEIDVLIYQTREHLDTLLGYGYKLLKNPILIVTGDAGCGKSHLLADLAFSRMKNNEISILLLGNHFYSNDTIGKQIVDELEVDLTSQEFLEKLNDKAKYRKSRILIIIDALNECKNTQLWETRLNRFINEIKKYKWLGLIVSIRSTYLDLIPENIIEENNGYAHKIMPHQTFELIKTLCEEHNINYPAFPPISNIFSNPLFLKLLFKNIKKSGKNTIPQTSLNFSTVINTYLNNIEKNIQKNFPIPPGFDVTRMFVGKLIKLKLNSPISKLNSKDSIEIEKDISNQINRNFPIINLLIEEELFYEDKYDNEVILKFSHEKIEDYLIADYLLENIEKENVFNEFKKNGKIHKIIAEGNEINYYGIFEAFAVLIPEKFGIELYEIDLNDFNESISKNLFNWTIHSLYWRIPKTIKENVLEYIKNEIKNSNNKFDLFFESMILLSSNPNYILNANKLHEILLNSSMSERDSYWLPWIDLQYRLEYSVYRVVDWALSIKNNEFDDESLKLFTILLSWFLTSNNKELRDKSTYALINLLKNKPKILLDLLELFENVDDIYIIERLYAVTYGCILSYKNPSDIKLLAEYTYNTVFLKNKFKPNILLKDYCQSIINYSNSQLNLNFSEIKNHTSLKIPSKNEIEILEKESVPKDRISGGFYIFSSMYEHARSFGNDEFKPKIKYWDYKFSYDDLKNIVIKQTFELYDERLHGNYDMSLEEDRYPLRASTYRIGEKYQRIAFYELLDILSINYKIQNPFMDETARYLKGAWEIDARNFDPTLNLKNKIKSAAKISDSVNFDISKEDWSETLGGIPEINNLIEQKNLFNNNDEWSLLFGQLNLNDSNKINFKCHEPTKGVVLEILGLIVKNEEKDEIIEKLKYEDISHIDPIHERQHQVFDKEFSWANSYINLKELKDFGEIGYYNSSTKNHVHIPFDENEWEFDYYLKECFNKNLLKPSRLLFEKMNLEYGAKDNILYINDKEVVIDLSKPDDFEYRLIIDKKELISFLNENDLDIVWLVYGFKITYENWSHDYDKQLYLEGIYCLDENYELTGYLTYNHYNKPYVGNKKTKKVHLNSCRHIQSLNKENTDEFRTINDAIKEGFKPCKKCLSNFIKNINM